MESSSSDGEEERKPSSVRLLADLVTQQMEASQRREERVIALLSGCAQHRRSFHRSRRRQRARGARTAQPTLVRGQLRICRRGLITDVAPARPTTVRRCIRLCRLTPARRRARPTPARRCMRPEPSREGSGEEARALTGHPGGDRGAAGPGPALRASLPPAAGHGPVVTGRAARTATLASQDRRSLKTKP